MQKHTHTTFLLLLKKKNEHEVLVICARSKKKCFLRISKNSGKFKVTQGSFQSLWEVFFRLKEWQPCIKGIGEVEHFFYKLILFNTLLLYLLDAFYSLAKFKVVFKILGVKAGEFNRFFMELKTRKQTISLKIYILLQLLSNLLQTFTD